jgi:Ni,Fe-hydrogenase I cytochrome b subunit
MADHHQNDHKQGTMDIGEQEKTFEGFIRMSVWVVCISIGILVFLGLVNS